MKAYRPKPVAEAVLRLLVINGYIRFPGPWMNG